MDEWIDISQPLTNEIAVWPGDAPFSYQLASAKKDNGIANVGEIKASVHTGTHIDAPYHFNDDGKKIHELDLDIFIGKALVVDVSGLETIGKSTLEDYSFDGVERLLLKTRNKVDVQTFPASYANYKPNLAPFLKEKGIFLLGVDSPSVDPVESETLETHHSLYENGIHILENIVLSHVRSGMYELIALPLPIVGADGSMTRAVLRKI